MNKKFQILSAFFIVVCVAVVILLQNTESARQESVQNRGGVEKTSRKSRVSPSNNDRVVERERARVSESSHQHGAGCGCSEHSSEAVEPASLLVDEVFMDKMLGIAEGAAVDFPLPGGGQARGTVSSVFMKNGQVVSTQGLLQAPQKGYFFFRKQLEQGLAGNYVGMVAFNEGEIAYHVEAQEDGSSKLVRKHVDEVLCHNYDVEGKGKTEADQGGEIARGFEDHPEDGTPPSYQNEVPRFESLPGATAVLYLDFDGQEGPIEGWPQVPNGAARSQLTAAQIREAWEHVSENFAPFNVNVTTDLTVYLAAPETSRQRCLHSKSSPQPAGVASVGSFNWGGDVPCWVQYNGTNGYKLMCHELGHTLKLGHHGRVFEDGRKEVYYNGHGPSELKWGPIMGGTYTVKLSQWSKGDYPMASRPDQDDLAIIATYNNNVDYRSDDHGDSFASASYLEVLPDHTASQEGIIERREDFDSFRFTTTAAGVVSLSVRGAMQDSNLDILAEIVGSNGNVIVSGNPDLALGPVTLTKDLPAGSYFLRVSGVGRGDLTNGYTDYDSLGYYKVTGTVPNSIPAGRFSVAENSANGTAVGTVAPNKAHGANPLTFAIASGNDPAALQINASSGEITVADSTLLDFEAAGSNYDNPSQFELFVSVTDTVDSSLNETVRVVVTVENVNEAPSVVGADNIHLLEHTLAGTFLHKVVASDPDYKDVLTYTITEGNEGGFFAIDNLGNITVVADITATAPTSIYNLTVKVTDTGSPALTATATVSVTLIKIEDATKVPGSISQTSYYNIEGKEVELLEASNKYPHSPDKIYVLKEFRAASVVGNSGAAVRGFIIPPVSGEYTFWVSGNKRTKLWLSTDASPDNLELIARSDLFTAQDQWDKFPSQKSVVKNLEAGKLYYVQFLCKNSINKGHGSVAWQGPGIERQVIHGRFIAPYFITYTPLIHTPDPKWSVGRDTYNGYIVGNVGITDFNAGETHQYAIVGGNSNGAFTIDSNTGKVSVADFTKLIYGGPVSLQIRVTDSGTPALFRNKTIIVNEPLTNYASAGNETSFVASSTDLGKNATITRSAGSVYTGINGGNASQLINGTSASGSGLFHSSGTNESHFPATYDIELDTATHPNGYTVTGIDTFAGWGVNGQTLANQKYDVYYRRVGSTDYQLLSNQNYTPFTNTTGASSSKISITASSGVLVTHVASIRFVIQDHETHTGDVKGTVFKEFDILGRPTLTVTKTSATDETTIVASSTDLGASATITRSAGSVYIYGDGNGVLSGKANELIDGSAGNGDGILHSAGSNGNHFPATYDIDLDISSNVNGYTITSIDTIAGWGVNGRTLANQKYEVFYSVVGSSDYISLGTQTYLPFSGTSGASASKISLSVNSGVIAKNVDSIRFVIQDHGKHYGNVTGTIFKEFDIFGTPDPVIVVNSQHSQGTAFASTAWAGSLSSTDLINSGQSTLGSTSVPAPTSGAGGMNDGTATSAFYSSATGFPVEATYNLNVSTHTKGYDITSIESFMGWESNAGIHANQTYTVAVKTLGSANYRQLATVNFTPFGTADVAHHESHITLTGSDTGVLASGVDSIRFTLLSPGTVGNDPGTVVREIDVQGYPTGTSVAVTTPSVRQVVQRNSQNTANIPVRGHYTGSPDSIEARFSNASLGTTSAWQTIDSSLTGGSFSGTLSNVAAGGWYDVEVRSVTSGKPSPISKVAKVGVGDVFIIAGESNSANHGSLVSTPINDLVSARSSLTGNTWTVAVDPMPLATGVGGSPWALFGNLYVTSENVPVGIMSVGSAVTSTTQWQPGGALYPRIKSAVKSFPANGFKAILWHQGESDSGSLTAAQYQTNLEKIISESRSDAGWNVPWYLSEASFTPTANLAQELPIAEAQRATAYADPFTLLGARTDDFHLKSKTYDGIHFNAAGLLDHATQWHTILTRNPAFAIINGDLESNSPLNDNGIATTSISAVHSPSVIGYQMLSASGTAAADGQNKYYNPSSAIYYNTNDGVNGGVAPNMAGKHVAALNNGSAGNYFFQSLRTRLEPNNIYNLTVAIGRKKFDTFGGTKIEILANGVPIATTSIAESDLVKGTFKDFTATFTAPDNQGEGQELAIRIVKVAGSNTYVDFDNIRLTNSLTAFGAWQKTNYGSTSNPLAKKDLDADSDGLSNFMEFFLGTSPNEFNTLPVPIEVGSSSQIQIPLNPTATDLGLDLEYTFNLKDWYSVTAPAAGHTGIQSTRTNTLWTAQVPFSLGDRIFYRLKTN